ncbi:uncharacterized protein LOC144596961 [Rhinoraja longicauda]
MSPGGAVDPRRPGVGAEPGALPAGGGSGARGLAGAEPGALPAGGGSGARGPAGRGWERSPGPCQPGVRVKSGASTSACCTPPAPALVNLIPPFSAVDDLDVWCFYKLCRCCDFFCDGSL